MLLVPATHLKALTVPPGEVTWKKGCPEGISLPTPVLLILLSPSPVFFDPYTHLITQALLFNPFYR